jgi:sugar phosphate isomerase/epimerase
LTLADDCSTHVEIYQRAFDPVIYADSHRAAPAELLDALDALGLDRCGAPPLGFWHQAPAGLDKRTQRQIVSRAAAALCSAGWVVNIEPRLLDKDAYDTAVQEAARVTRAT